MTYRASNGRQYVVIAAGGHPKISEERFALDGPAPDQSAIWRRRLFAAKDRERLIERELQRAQLVDLDGGDDRIQESRRTHSGVFVV